MIVLSKHAKIVAWQIMYLLAGTTWLLAPYFNHVLSYRTTLISQYETAAQPMSLFFRGGDLLAGLLLLIITLTFIRNKHLKLPYILLLAISVGMMLDPLLPTTCHLQGNICNESLSFQFILHAVETVFTAAAIIALSAYDSIVRKKTVSLLFLIFQCFYGILFLTQYVERQGFNTASQFVYQAGVILWLAWFCRDYLLGNEPEPAISRTRHIRQIVSIWVLINGIFSIVASLAHIHLLGQLNGLYFAGQNAWLAQHGVIVGVIMIYLSRHLMRGELRARQLLLIVFAGQAIKYSVITPNLALYLLYMITFVLLFAAFNDFSRGTVTVTQKLRIKDVAYLLSALSASLVISLLLLDRDNRVSQISSQMLSHFRQYALSSQIVTKHQHLESVLLAHTLTALIFASLVAVLWILFRPYKDGEETDRDDQKITHSLKKYSNFADDYFKKWPNDKDYFWNKEESGFIAYKVVGPVAFALADPICSAQQRDAMVSQFTNLMRSKRLRVCFIPVQKASLNNYASLNQLQIGSAAIIDNSIFVNQTVKDKWWRWKRNRAIKAGYEYKYATPPHSAKFIMELRQVSDNWLASGKRQERNFALGYFDEKYLQECLIHFLTDKDSNIVAFTNQLPTYNSRLPATIDMLRFNPEATEAMAFLLSNLIGELYARKVEKLDLGFVPFAKTKGQILSIAQAVSASTFSAKGLEQFKNKFEPEWQPVHIAYDGDLADLALIAINLERAMKV